MSYRIDGPEFHLARTKEGLIKQAKPLWNGKIMELRAMEKPQLRAIVRRLMTEQINKLMKFDKNISDNTNNQTKESAV